MATLIETPEYSANEIYEIQQTDPVEGAATGAGFGGIGVSNQPHQQLANRTAFLKGRQDTNIANIGVLQSFMAKFAGSMQQNGYLKIPITDASRGSVTAIIQWGFLSLPALGVRTDQQYTVYFPLTFPSVALSVLATNNYFKTEGNNMVASVVSWWNSGATFVLDVPGATSSGPEQTNGFFWLAIGF
jgi:Putative tail fiber protein gp53-like, C-terminal